MRFASFLTEGVVFSTAHIRVALETWTGRLVKRETESSGENVRGERERPKDFFFKMRETK